MHKHGRLYWATQRLPVLWTERDLKLHRCSRCSSSKIEKKNLTERRDEMETSRAEGGGGEDAGRMQNGECEAEGVREKEGQPAILERKGWKREERR